MVRKRVLRCIERPLLVFLCQHTCSLLSYQTCISRFGVECVASYSAIKFDVACNPCSNLVCSSKLIYCMRRVLYPGFVRNFSNNTGFHTGVHTGFHKGYHTGFHTGFHARAIALCRRVVCRSSGCCYLLSIH